MREGQSGIIWARFFIMSIAAAPIPSGRPQPKRWSGDEFDEASRRGIFDGQRLELINGELLERPPMNDPHAEAIQLVNFALVQVFPMLTHTVRIQCPMRLGNSRPFPDLVLVTGGPRQVPLHPTSALLVVEVSDSSLDYDRDDKAKLYAAHNLQEYWIVNINGRCVEVHRNPITDASGPHYADIRPYTETESLSPLAASQASIRVADLLP
jgi:Uma2 family endonuclease